MTTRIGFNANGAAIADVDAFKKHLVRLQPTAQLIMDNFTLATELAALLPNTIVMHRDYGRYNGDDDLSVKISAADWLSRQQTLGHPEVWRYVLNENGWNEKTLQWLIDLIHLRIAQGTPIKFVIGNWSAGTPQPEALGLGKALLQLCDQYRAWCIWGTHEYFGAVPTSGFYGGNPDNANHQPNVPGGYNLIPFANWPKPTTGIIKFHCGRFEFLVKYCNQQGIKPPRIIITEHGADFLSDIGNWLNTLQKSPGYASPNGVNALFQQYRAWYSQTPGWTPEGAYFEMLRYLDEYVYKGSPVEGQLIFTWSESSDWRQDNVAHLSEFQGLLEAYAQLIPYPTPPPVVTPPPIVTPPPPTETLYTVVITIPGLTLAQAQAVQKNIVIKTQG